MMTQFQGPRGNWLLGNLIQQRNDPIGLMMGGLRDYGDIVRYRFGPYSALQLNDPRDIKHVLIENPSRYHKWGALQRAAPLLGNGLFLAEDEHWRRQRKLQQPAFHRLRLNAMLDEMVTATRALVDEWSKLPNGATVNLSEACMRLTLSIVSRALLSTDIGGFSSDAGDDAKEIERMFELAVQEVSERTLSLDPIPGLLPTRKNRRFEQAVKGLDDKVRRIIEARRARPSAANDLLAMFMEEKDDETGERMSDAQLRDEIMTILLTGRGPSANGLTWTWYLVQKHPEVERRMRAEVETVLGGREPTLEDLPRLEYVGRVFQEALRLYPPAWTLARQAITEDEIRGVALRPGTVILISSYVVHRNPKLWEDPERFDPDRFLPERAASRPHLAYMPFGAGPRTCIGASFALMEAKVILSMLLQRFQFRLSPCEVAVPDPLITLKPKRSLRVALHHAGVGGSADSSASHSASQSGTATAKPDAVQVLTISTQLLALWGTVRLLLALKRKPSKALWERWYDLMSRLARVIFRDLPFMNYGYDPLSGVGRPRLQPIDEKDRFQIQLYHHVASDGGAYDLRGQRVLEVGSGRGGGASYVARYLGPTSMKASDLSRVAVEACTQRFRAIPNLSFHHGDAEHLPFGDDTFDAVLNVESSHCYPDLPRFLEEVARVLVPGGRLHLADFRPTEELNTLFSQLDGSPFERVATEDVTPNVLAALERDNERKLSLIERSNAPVFLQTALRDFTACVGSPIYQRFAMREWTYMRFVLRTPHHVA